MPMKEMPHNGMWMDKSVYVMRRWVLVDGSEEIESAVEVVKYPKERGYRTLHTEQCTNPDDPRPRQPYLKGWAVLSDTKHKTLKEAITVAEVMARMA